MTTIGVVPPSGAGVVANVGLVESHDSHERSAWSTWAIPSALNVGSNQVTGVFAGSSAVDALYVGSTRVW